MPSVPCFLAGQGHCHSLIQWSAFPPTVPHLPLHSLGGQATCWWPFPPEQGSIKASFVYTSVNQEQLPDAEWDRSSALGQSPRWQQEEVGWDGTSSAPRWLLWAPLHWQPSSCCTWGGLWKGSCCCIPVAPLPLSPPAPAEEPVRAGAGAGPQCTPRASQPQAGPKHCPVVLAESLAHTVAMETGATAITQGHTGSFSFARLWQMHLLYNTQV